MLYLMKPQILNLSNLPLIRYQQGIEQENVYGHEKLNLGGIVGEGVVLDDSVDERKEEGTALECVKSIPQPSRS